MGAMSALIPLQIDRYIVASRHSQLILHVMRLRSSISTSELLYFKSFLKTSNLNTTT